jgi:hypothetical protein
VVYSANTVYAYSDGQYKGSGNITPIVSNSRDISVGRIDGEAGLTQWYGNIGAVKIYNRCLNNSEVLQNYNALKPRYSFISLPEPTPSFSPLNYSPIAWYDSSDLGTITKDLSDKVSQWNDKSGNGYHLTQTGATYQPTYSATNGIVFDGTNDYLSKNFGFNYNQPITIFIVAKINDSRTQFLYDGYESVASETKRLSLLYLSPNGMAFLAGLVVQTAEPVPSTYKIFSNIFDTTNSKLIVNNSTTYTGSAGTNFLPGITLGNAYVGYSNMSQYALNGYIKEIIIYPSALTTDQITAVNNYLNSKYVVY